jgi:hypothetical protein
MGKNLNRQLTKDDLHMEIKYMKRCSTSFVHRELQIKTIMWTSAHLLGWLKSKNWQRQGWWGWKNQKLHCLLEGMQMCSHSGRQSAVSHKIDTLFPHSLAIMLLGTFPTDVIFFFFFGGIRLWRQGLAFARQVLYHRSHATIPFCFSCFF